MSIDEIKMLDITERIILVEEIWDSIVQEQESLPLSDNEKKVLDERLMSFESNPQDLVSWGEIKNIIRS